jgi:hypothetical protein
MAACRWAPSSSHDQVTMARQPTVSHSQNYTYFSEETASILTGKRPGNSPETAHGTAWEPPGNSRETAHDLPLLRRPRSPSSPAIPTASLSSHNRAHPPLAILIATIATIPMGVGRARGRGR